MCYTDSRISGYERSFVSMSQAAAQQPSRKKTVISLLVLLALTCIIVFTFKDHWAEITAALAQQIGRASCRERV